MVIVSQSADAATTLPFRHCGTPSGGSVRCLARKQSDGDRWTERGGREHSDGMGRRMEHWAEAVAVSRMHTIVQDTDTDPGPAARADDLTI